MRTVVVGTAGHIDHGKSALVLALTGTDPDRLKEEKARGITIELGFAHAAVAADVTASFVDVPGHERFVRAMLAGVGGIDVVLLVVAADESVMPQTREHFAICRLLGVAHGLVVITKVDAAEPGMTALVAADVQALVAGSFLDGAPILEVSAHSGAGLDALRTAIADLGRRVPRRPARGSIRLPVDRAFTMKGFGTVVTGTLTQGTLDLDDELVLLPAGRPVKVRGLHVHGSARPTATAGERAAVNLAAVDVAEVGRGSVLATPEAFAVTRRADVHLTLLPGESLKHGARVRVHHGTAELLARVSVAGEAGLIPPGSSADVRLRFERDAVLARRDRLVVRTYSPLVTIGGGVVLDPLPPRPGVRTARGVTRMAALAVTAEPVADRAAAVSVLVASAGANGVSVTGLMQRLGCTRAEAAAPVDGLVRHDRAVRGGNWVVAQEALSGPIAAMLSGLAAFHASHPLAAGLALDTARGRWFRGVPGAVVDTVVAKLVTQGRLVASDTLALPSHRVELSADDAVTREWLEQRFRAAGLAPPDVAGLAAASGRPAATVQALLQFLVKTRILVRLDTLVFHHEALARLKDEVRAGKGTKASVDVKAFKDTYGLSRKFAIPLLEYLDRERVTRRVGDARIIL